MSQPVAAPSHLEGHVVAVPTHLADTRRYQVRSAAGGELFQVRYAGALWPEYNLIVGAGDVPALVVAVAQGTGEQIVLFDAARHGRAAARTAVVRDAHAPQQTYASPSGGTVFRILVEVQDDAATADPDDFIALSVCGIDEDGDRTWFVEEDLA